MSEWVGTSLDDKMSDETGIEVLGLLAGWY